MTATTTDPDVETDPEVEADEDLVTEVDHVESWDTTSVVFPQHTLATDDTVTVPEFDLGQVVHFVASAKVRGNAYRVTSDEDIDRRATAKVQMVALVGHQDAEDFLAGERQRRTGQLEMLSTVGELRRAGRTFADRAEHHRAEGRTREQVDGWGIRVVLGRAAGHLTAVKDLTTDDGETHPLHWTDPASIDEDVIDIVEREIDEAGAYLCAARDWAIRHRGRLNEARAEAKKLAAQDGVVLTDTEADDLRDHRGNGIHNGGPRGVDAQTVAVLEVLKASPTWMTTANVSDEANVSTSRARDILNELESKGAIVKQQQGNAHAWATAVELEDGSGSAASDEDATPAPVDGDVVPSLDELDDTEA